MTTIPITILDDFLDNPDTIRNWGLSLPFESSDDGRWPGKRTECLSKIHPPFYNYINRKILSLFFEDPVNYDGDLTFQLIEDYQGEGWVHQDSNVFTYIIYLSPENEINCGTSLYNLNSKKIHNKNTPDDDNLLSLTRHHHKTKLISPDIENIQKYNLNSNYIKTLDINDKFNRVLCFSAEKFHKANNFSNNTSPRLTLIGFIHKISSSNLPIIRSKQTIMM
jgi:hypothetical protein